jgi:hypothetical protein
MADDLERASIADVGAENADDELPIDLDVLLFGARHTQAIVDLDGEALAENDEQEVDDGAPTPATHADSGLEPIGGYRGEWRPTGGADETFDATDLVASRGGGAQPIGGDAAEWSPSGSASESFDPTDVRVGAGTSDGMGPSDGVGAIDARLRITDDVRYADDARPPGDGAHDIDIDTTGLEPEPTEIWLGPAELGDDPVTGAVTEVSDTYAPVVATESPNFEDVD